MDLAGNTGEVIASVTWIEDPNSIVSLIYDPDVGVMTSGTVTATLTGTEAFIVTNNG